MEKIRNVWGFVRMILRVLAGTVAAVCITLILVVIQTVACLIRSKC